MPAAPCGVATRWYRRGFLSAAQQAKSDMKVPLLPRFDMCGRWAENQEEQDFSPPAARRGTGKLGGLKQRDHGSFSQCFLGAFPTGPG